MATVFTANRSNVTLDGAVVEGLQSLVFRVVTEREDIRAVGSNERIDVSFGLRTVQGEIVVKSANYTLDTHLQKQSRFQMMVNLKKDEGPDAPKRTLTLDGCFVETKSFGMDAGGSAITTYGFTAASLNEQ